MRLILLTFLLLSWSCGPKKNSPAKADQDSSKTQTSPDTDKSYLAKRPEEFPDFFRLSSVQPFRGRVAKKEDVESGEAVFHFDTKDKSHKPCEMTLPFFAFRKVPANPPVFVAVVQAEVLQRDTFLGYREASGRIDVKSIKEFEFFESQKLNSLIPSQGGQ